MIHFDSVTYSIGENASGIPQDTLITVKPGLFRDNYFIVDCRLGDNGNLLDLKELRPLEKPVFIGYFTPRDKKPEVLVVRDVQRGIIAKGQNFASRTLRNVIEGFEKAGHKIKAVIFDAVFTSEHNLKLDNNPLLKTLVKVGYGKIRVVEIEYTPRYYQLVGERSDEVSCEYELLNKKK